MYFGHKDKGPIYGKAKSVLKGEVTDRKYKFPVSGLELQGNLLVRRLKHMIRGLGEEELVQVVVPRKLVQTVLKVIHELMGSNHCGVDRTYKAARARYYWKGMYRDIEDYVKHCAVCNSYKSGVAPAPIASYPVPSKPFERVHMDLLSGFSESSQGNKHLLVIVDELTRYTEMYPIRNKTAEEVAITFFKLFICRHGVPEILVSDNGREFVNRMLNDLADLCQIKKVLVLPYRPQANGLVERANRKILENLRTTVGGSDPNWDSQIDYVRFSINTALSESIGMSPHKALYGVDVRNPFDFFTSPVKCSDPIGTVVQNAKNRFLTLRNNLQEASEKMTQKVNLKQGKSKVSVGDKVFVKVNVRNELNYKMGVKFEGPYIVKEKLIANKFRVVRESDQVEKVVHCSHLKLVGNTKKKVKKRVRFAV